MSKRYTKYISFTRVYSTLFASILFVVVYLFSHISHAQNDISTTSFLQSTLASNRVAESEQNLQFLRGINYNLPLVKSLELRTETRDFVFDRQEYSIRVKPNTLRAITHQKKVFQNKVDEVSIENQIYFNNALKERYQLLVDYIFTVKMEALIIQNKLLLKDKLQVISQDIYDTNFDVKDLIDTEEQLLDAELKADNLKNQLSDIGVMIQYYLNTDNTSATVLFDDLIKPEQIINWSVNSAIPESQRIKLQRLELLMIQDEMQLSKLKSEQIFDYFQAKYGGRNTIIFEEKFSLGMGLNIPFFGNSRIKKADYYFDKLKKETKLNEEIKRFETELSLSQKEYNEAIINYQNLISQVEKSSVVSLLETYKKMEGVSPLLLLKLKILQHKKLIAALKSEHEMYRKFIGLLAQNETLFQKPLKNYLSNTLEMIEL